MATITKADAQAWLERQADHWMETGGFTSDVVPGATRLACEVTLDSDDLRDARRLERIEPKPVTFYCLWYGVKLTTVRGPATRGARCCH